MLARNNRHRILQGIFWNPVGFSFLRFIKYNVRRIETVLFNKSLHSETNGEYWLLDQLSDNPVVLDVGYNEGDFTKELLARRPTGTVFAFDPAKSAAAANQRDFSKDNRVVFSNIALSSEVGSAVFHDYGNMCGSLASRTDAGDEKSSYEVPVERLDSWCNSNNVEEIDLLKIDAEGYDFPVLKGAESLLYAQKITAFQFEYADGWIASRYFLHDLMQFMEDKPYSIYQLFNGFLMPFDYSTVEERFDCGRMFVGVANRAQTSFTQSTHCL